MPDAPTLSVANDGDGSSVTASVTGTGTITLYHRKSSATAWSAGSSRSGDGDIAQSGLDSALYEFVAVAEDGGALSLPSSPVFLSVEDPDALTTPVTGDLLVLSNLRDLVAASATWQDWVGAGNAAQALRHVRYFGVDPPAPWAALTAYGLGVVVVTEPNNSLVYECTAAGTSGASEPTWPLVAALTVVDGSATWTARDLQGTPDNTAVRLARPYAAVGLEEELTLDQSGYHGAELTGSLAIMIQAEVPAAYQDTFAAAGQWFLKKLGAVRVEMNELACSPGYIGATAIDLTSMERIPTEKTRNEGDFFEAFLSVQVRGLP